MVERRRWRMEGRNAGGLELKRLCTKENPNIFSTTPRVPDRLRAMLSALGRLRTRRSRSDRRQGRGRFA
jgi:hypothetical protein